ncbi:MAG: Uncharacterised protein [Cryomorphaceae bacterium]|nr:MAG: Uncharacterised protein [Cryomorphaceae bacterium]
MREPHKQICPWFAKDERTEVLSASSKSQSSKITFAFLPPSSKLSFLNIGAATLLIAFPVAVPPVNEITAVSGCSTIAAPASPPSPCTRFSTPFGNPISARMSLSKYAVAGVTSEGFATTVFPAAKAGAIFQLNKYKGRFHGEIQPATPIG